MDRYTDAAPVAYPEVNHLTAPLRQAARQSGRGDVVNLWAGQAHALARNCAAAELVTELVAEMRTALGPMDDR
jgi:nitronate monooxygenase